MSELKTNMHDAKCTVHNLKELVGENTPQWNLLCGQYPQLSQPCDFIDRNTKQRQEEETEQMGNPEYARRSAISFPRADAIVTQLGDNAFKTCTNHAQTVRDIAINTEMNLMHLRPGAAGQGGLNEGESKKAGIHHRQRQVRLFTRAADWWNKALKQRAEGRSESYGRPTDMSDVEVEDIQPFGPDEQRPAPIGINDLARAYGQEYAEDL